LPTSARLIPSQPDCNTLKIVVDNGSDDDLIALLRRLYAIAPKLGKLHKFRDIQITSSYRGEELCALPPEPVPIALLIKDFLRMLPKRSSLNLSTAEVDLNTELLYATLPVGIVRIKDFVVLNANTLLAEKNHKDLGDMLGRPVDSLFTQEVIEQYLADLTRSGSLSEYDTRACFFAKREEGGTIYTVRDEFNFVVNSKHINYGGADCYMIEFAGEELVRRGEVASISTSS
jgi:glycosyltransferase involved in cell wall biosynthesis